jgi:hypothetical protein
VAVGSGFFAARTDLVLDLVVFEITDAAVAAAPPRVWVSALLVSTSRGIDEMNLVDA